MKKLLALLVLQAVILLASLGAQAWATDYYISVGRYCTTTNCHTTTLSGNAQNAATNPGPGSDSNPGTFASPFLTFRKCFDTIGFIGGAAGAGSRCIARGGVVGDKDHAAAYDTSMTDGSGNRRDGFIVFTVGVGQEVGVPSGSVGNPFIIKSYHPSGGAVDCTPATMPRPGDQYGLSTCETVKFINPLFNCTGSSCANKTLLEIQTPNTCFIFTRDCAGVPIPSECDALHAIEPNPGTYPNNCFGGGGGSDFGYLWLYRDRTGGQIGGNILDFATIQTPDSCAPGGGNQTHRTVRYVTFDGIDFDGRGIATNLFASTVIKCDNVVAARFLRFQNVEWKNANASCISQPTGGTNEVDSVTKVKHRNDFAFVNFKIHRCGVPFNSYMIGSVNGRDHPDAKFLHAWYFHVGASSCDYCESTSIAGQGLSPADDFNVIDHSYVHDVSLYGIQMYDGALNSTTPISNLVQNTLIVNAGGSCMQVRTVNARNNTCVNPPGATFPAGTGFEVMQDGRSHGNLFENNIISGYSTGIANAQCDDRVRPGTGLIYCDKDQIPTARNNLIYGATPGHEIVNIGIPWPPDNTDPVVVMEDINNLKVQPPGFTNAAAGDYSLTIGSAARGTGYAPSCPANDIIGTERKSPCDIGAYEYGSTGTQPVNTVIDSHSANDPTTSTTQIIAFHGTGGAGGFTYECNIDAGSYTSCTSPKTNSSLSLASHTFCVKATDSGAAVDATPACFTWVIQTAVPPVVTITSSPANPTTNTNASFAWTATPCTGTCAATCSLDGAAFASCTTNLTQSYAGPLNATCAGNNFCDHNFQVKVVDSGTSLPSNTVSLTWRMLPPTVTAEFLVGSCIQVKVPSLNVRNAWPNGTFCDTCQQGYPAIGKIVETSANVDVNGRTGIRVDYLTGTRPEVDGWHSVNTANIESYPTCPFASSGVLFSIGSGTIKLDATLKLGGTQ